MNCISESVSGLHLLIALEASSGQDVWKDTSAGAYSQSTFLSSSLTGVGNAYTKHLLSHVQVIPDEQ